MSDRSFEQLRQFVDGELPQEELAAWQDLAASDEHVQRHIKREQMLKTRVHALMQDEKSSPVPAGLADRIKLAIVEAAASATSDSETGSPNTHDEQGEPVIARIDSNPEVAKSFTQRWGIDIRAAAAVLIIITGAVLVGIFGSQIDEWGLPTPAQQLVSDSTAFVSGEHGRCAMDRQATELKMKWSSIEQAERSCAEYLDVDAVFIPDFSDAGYAFMGAGPCAMPSKGNRSVHVMYQRDDPNLPNAKISLFIAPDHGQYDPAIPWIDQGKWESPSVPGCRISCAGNGTVVYFMVACDLEDGDSFCCQSLSEWQKMYHQ